MSKTILIVETGDQDFRGYILESLYKSGFSIIILKQEEPTWETKYTYDSIVADLSNYNLVLDRIRAITNQTTIDGVFTYVEPYIELTAKISMDLNLHFYDPIAAKKARDKHSMRQALKTHGLIVPEFTAVEHGLKEALTKVGFPAIIKPIDGHSSINVIKIEREQDIRVVEERLIKDRAVADWGIQNQYIVEQYIAGVEVSVESIVFRNEVFHLCMTDKYKLSEPYFEEIGHTLPSKINSSVQKEIFEVVDQGIRALDLNNCAVHTEVRYSNKGPVIIEIGGRLAGDKIPFLVQSQSNIDMGLLAGQVAVNEKPSIPDIIENNGFISICFFYPKYKQVLKQALELEPPISGVVEFKFWTNKGDEVAPPPEQFFSRMGYVITEGSTYEESRERSNQVLQWVSHNIDVELISLEEE